MFPNKLFRSSIDQVNGRFISGWCFNRLRKAHPVTIRIAADDRLLGTVTNNGYRPDLKEKKLHPSGVCGFDFSFPADFAPERCRNIHLYFTSSGQPTVTIATGELEHLIADPPKRIVFMLIPKTAGSSFNAFSRHCFSKDEYFPHIERLQADKRPHAANRAKYVAGHLPFHEISSLIDVESFALYALLREPYHHLHSHLNYVRNVHRNSDLERYYQFRHNDTIHAFGKRLSTVNFDNDDEIRIFVSTLSGFELEFFDNIQTRYFLDYQPEKITPADLENARENADRFRRVGLTEKYDRFREEFCADIGLAPQSQNLQSNKSQHYRLFDLSNPSTREALLPLVETDLMLYDYISRTIRS